MIPVPVLAGLSSSGHTLVLISLGGGGEGLREIQPKSFFLKYIIPFPFMLFQLLPQTSHTENCDQNYIFSIWNTKKTL